MEKENTTKTKFSAPLTAQEIRDIDNIQADTTASENTLQVALNFFSNFHTELQKRKNKFWDDLYKKHGLNKDKEYTIDNSGTEILLREK